MLRTLIAALALSAMSTAPAWAQPAPAAITVDSARPGAKIDRDIFGQFSEMLGEGVEGGIWVGANSRIPNVRGIRSDVVGALKALKVPFVRWPGGCYADAYHWRDGIGPMQQRKARLNAIWGGVVEPNQFGTHEYMDFLEQIGSAAYISVNLGSGTVQEASDWLEYMTVAQPTALGKERAANGHAGPWKIKYLGLGNESWGCGGAFSPQAYVESMKRYTMGVRNLHPDQLETSFRPAADPMRRIAVGYEGDTDFTEAVMQAWKSRQPWFWNIDGLSIHKYTMVGRFPMTDASTDFGEKDYAALLKNVGETDALIAKQSAVMDKYDPDKKIALVIDEWGAWLKPLPGRNPMFLYQQGTLRDGLLAALSLNVFARHADRVRMTAIAQMVNVIQSMVLTDGADMVLTPTYHVYRMYVPFQDARFVPVEMDRGEYRFGDLVLPRFDAIAARGTDGRLWLAVTNLDPNQGGEVSIRLRGSNATAAVGETLTGPRVDSFNAFRAAPAVAPVPIRGTVSNGVVTLRLQPKSVTVVRLDAPAEPAPAAEPKYTSRKTTIGALLADPAARAVIDRHLPGFSSNPQVQMTAGLTLRAVQSFAPEQLSNAALDAIDADLAKLAAE